VVERCQLYQLNTPAVQERVGPDEQGIRPLLSHIFEGDIDLAARAGVEKLDLQSYGTGSRFYVSHRELSTRIDRID
jgi:hypothetical protein